MHWMVLLVVMVVVVRDGLMVMNFMSMRAEIVAAEAGVAAAEVMSTKVVVEESALVLLLARLHGLCLLLLILFLRGNA